MLFRSLIRSADRVPAQRDTLYNHLRVHWTPADDPEPDERIASHFASTAPGAQREPVSGAQREPVSDAQRPSRPLVAS